MTVLGKSSFAVAITVVGLSLFGCGTDAASSPTTGVAQQALGGGGNHRHVLLVSLDGFHAFDLAKYVAAHPHSAMAKLSRHGVTYANANTTAPSDSWPGMLAMVTGGGPSSTGILYDNAWDDSLSPPGSACATLGANTLYDESVDFNIDSWTTTFDPSLLPLDPANGCTPVLPHQFIKVNTLFEVVKASGRRTAWCDKHPTYDVMNGPSGTGVDDLYTPESDAFDSDHHLDILEQNDDLKVVAVLNEIDGYDHTRTTHVGVPAIMGMDFQAPSVAQKAFGYANASGDPGPDLAAAFDFVDSELMRMSNELDAQGLSESTLFIVGSKHGNSPVDVTLRQALDDGPFADIINSIQPGLVAQVTTDDHALIWLTDHSKAAQAGAVLQANADQVGGGTVYTGAALDTLLGGKMIANRRPDIAFSATLGVIYTSHSKLVEHGGYNADDRHVSLMASNPDFDRSTVHQQVSNTQVAPTILKWLGLRARDLQAVRMEGTKKLPGIDNDPDDD